MKSNWSTASGDNGTKLLLPRFADYHGEQRPLVSTCRHSSKGISRNLVRVETKRCRSRRKPWKKCYRHIKIKMESGLIWSIALNLISKPKPYTNFCWLIYQAFVLRAGSDIFYIFLNTIWARDKRSENHLFQPEAIYIQLFGHNRQSKLCFC